ncbi:MAG: nitroreductase [Burkholderiaceae bacterium]
MTQYTFDSAINTRMSTRAFSTQAVPDDCIAAILRDASQLAAELDAYPWRVHVLRGDDRAALTHKVCDAHDAARADPALLEREGYDYYPRKWDGPYLERRRENGWGLYGLLGIGRADKDKMHAQHHRNFLFFDAPIGLVFTIDRAWVGSDMLNYGRFLQGIMVAARMRGLHTCPQAAWNTFGRIILRHVGAGPDAMLVCGMALGYAEPDAVVNTFRTPRLAVPEFTTWLD